MYLNRSCPHLYWLTGIARAGAKNIPTSAIFLSIILAMLVAILVAAPYSSAQLLDDTPSKEKNLRQVKNIFFDYDSHAIGGDTESSVKEIAGYLRSNPDVVVRIEAYADTKGEEVYNKDLASARAQAVKVYFMYLGISPERIITEHKGETSKFGEGEDDEALSLNRRAVLKLYSETEDEKKKRVAKTKKIVSKSTIKRVEKAPKDKKPRKVKNVEPKPPDVVSDVLIDASGADFDIFMALRALLQETAPRVTQFDPPKSMRLGVPETIMVSISGDISEKLSKRLRALDLKDAQGIKVGSPLGIELTGANFKIDPTIELGGGTAAKDARDWQWDVTPLRAGFQSLRIVVNLKVDMPDRGIVYKKFPLIERVVEVKSNPAYSAVSYFREHKAFILSIAFVFAGVLFARWKWLS